MKWHFAASLISDFSLALAWAFPQESTSPRDVSSAQMADQIVKKIAPVYPAEARRARIQGTVVLKVEISKSGDVEQIQLVSGHPMLAPAAIDSVKQWKYKPYLLNGEPIDVETRVTVNFTLAGTPPAEGVAGDMPGGIPAGEPGGIIDAPAVAGQAGVPQRVPVSQGVDVWPHNLQGASQISCGCQATTHSGCSLDESDYRQGKGMLPIFNSSAGMRCLRRLPWKPSSNGNTGRIC